MEETDKICSIEDGRAIRAAMRGLLRERDTNPQWRTAFETRRRTLQMRARVEAYWGDNWRVELNSLLRDRLEASIGQEIGETPVLQGQETRQDEPTGVYHPAVEQQSAKAVTDEQRPIYERPEYRDASV